jgi:hypothetical protein
MDKFSIRKEIAALINSIKEHSDNIGNSEHIPQLELELILNKIEKLYQKSIVFNHLNSTSKDSGRSRPVLSTDTEEMKEEALTPLSNKVTDLFGTEVPPMTEKPKVEKKEKPEKVTIRVEQPVVEKLQKPPVTDLRAAIGINDKFRFANELFNGVMQEYEIAIQQLNSSGSLESAMHYFISLQPLYNWDMENETVKQLLELVDRRYS